MESLATHDPDSHALRLRRSSAVGARTWGTLVASVMFAMILGALECWYGLTDAGDVFGSDGVQYLDCARAIRRGDLHTALNPLWSQGYPLLLAAARPLFADNLRGEWMVTRFVNFAIFCFSMVCFALLASSLRRQRAPWKPLEIVAAAAIFAAAQVALGQVSHVGPDELVSALFFLACGLVVNGFRRHEDAGVGAEGLRPGLGGRRGAAVHGGPGVGLGLGITLGAGFLAKAVFLPLGLVMLGLLSAGLLVRVFARGTAQDDWRTRRSLLLQPLLAGVVLVTVVLSYGAALSRQTGYSTIGEAGSLNYAWHVNRLAKWVHWEGGTEAADKAWPKPWIARFVRWQESPPDFGRPLHPTVVAAESPRVYVFGPTVYPETRVTYAPYYDPAHFYQGYRHQFHWRYQLVALGKSLADLVSALVHHPTFFALALALAALAWFRRKGERGRPDRSLLLPVACAFGGVLIYLPVHLELRYLAGFFAVVALALLCSVRETPRLAKVVALLLIVGCAGETAVSQRVVWGRAVHGWSVTANPEWQVAEAIRAMDANSGLPRGSSVGRISWTPGLHSDWAYLSGLSIVSEIANGADEAQFWAKTPAERQEVLRVFRAAGARAIFSWDQPPDVAQAEREGWTRVGATSMWELPR